MYMLNILAPRADVFYFIPWYAIIGSFVARPIILIFYILLLF